MQLEIPRLLESSVLVPRVASETRNDTGPKFPSLESCSATDAACNAAVRHLLRAEDVRQSPT